MTAESVYLSPAPLYHAAPLRFCMAAHALGGDRRRDGALRRRGVPRAHRAPPRHPHAGRADDVRAPAQAAARRPRPLRRVVAALRHPRRRALPGAGEAGDDRVVRAGDPRVLRRYRGQRVRLLQQRAVARPPGHRRGSPRVHRPHRRRRRRGGADRRERDDLLRERAPVRVPQRSRRRRPAPGIRRAGARSATSATSTTRATCT